MGIGINFSDPDDLHMDLRVHPEYPFTNGDIICWYEHKIEQYLEEPTPEDIERLENVEELVDPKKLEQKWGLLVYEPEVGSFLIIPYIDDMCEYFNEEEQPYFLYEIGIDAIFYPAGFEPWLEDEEDEDDDDEGEDDDI